ncbi:MAG: bifunctional methionine sulfoxide reductase B/A protein [Planctomycetota bacterium]|jgi:peptide methionine sulfoxide reductase msrA/msrB
MPTQSPLSTTARLGLSALLLLTALVPACQESLTATASLDDGLASSQAAAPVANAPSEQDAPMIPVRVFDSDGRLVGPISQEKVVRTDEEWRELLSDEQFRILRNKGTEPSFCGTLLDNKQEGVYACAGCGLPLFTSDNKFDSGTGWPSFFQPIAPENVAEHSDMSLGMKRTEILCARCDGHLGHVFEDGPRPTGLRYCLNSESLSFTEKSALASLADPGLAGDAAAQPATAAAVFAGGCFWCVEAVFEELDGVLEAVSGYAGGSAETANYEAVCSGTTGHAEAVRISYDASKIRYEELLQVHFATHDPTTLNRQGADVGTQYRSTIFYADEQERELAQAFLEDLASSGAYTSEIVTTLEPLTEFYPAENHHQDYVCNNPTQGYVRGVALPKVMKVRAKFGDKLKKVSPLDQ